MKNFLLFVLLLLCCNNFIEAQQLPTYAGIPGPENVLVVYKVQSGPTDTLGAVSDSVKEYYRLARGIPAENIVPLTIPDTCWFTFGGTAHRIEIVQGGDILKDTTQAWADRTPYYAGPSLHAWKFFDDTIAKPIRDHLTLYGLTSQIRYIVLCKGVPYKIQAQYDWRGAPGNLTFDGLLCMLNTENYSDLLDSLYENYKRSATLQTDWIRQPMIHNKYFDADKNFTMDYRFVPDAFTTQWDSFNVKLSYLVSHLDGLSFDIVKGIIDSSKNADTSGTATWVLDEDDTWHDDSRFLGTKNRLEALGFNVNWNDDGKWITHNNGPVIGYSSWGTHAEDGNCAFTDSNWVRDSLQYFQFVPGAIFNSHESFNGNSIGALKWRWIRPCTNQNIHTQGLATQFTEFGGTGTMGHAWEPYLSGVSHNEILMPAYAIGYNYLDAAYMGMEHLGWANVIIGDPLTRIFKQLVKVKKVLADDSTITSGNFYGELIVPAGKTLTIASYSTVKFDYSSLLQIDGNLVISNSSVLNFNGYSKLVDTVNTFELNQGTFNFNGFSTLTAKNLSLGSGEHLHFNNNATLSVNGINILPGARLIINDQSKIQVKNKFLASGTPSNRIQIISNSPNIINIDDVRVVELSNAAIENISLDMYAQTNMNSSINIDNVEFNNLSAPIYFSSSNSVNDVNFTMRNSSISGSIKDGGIMVNLVKNLTIDNVTIINDTLSDTPAISFDSYYQNTDISYCNISNFKVGIYSGRFYEYVANPNPTSESIIYNNTIGNCVDGIFVPYSYGPLHVMHNVITNPLSGQNVNSSAISILNCTDAVLRDNTILDYDYGINLSFVTNPYISGNSIQILNNSETMESGIFSNSSHGIYRTNFISGYKKAIELGNSNPKIGQNIITNNTKTGIYITSGSFPDLSGGIIIKEGEPHEIPISGLNIIYENGGEYEEIYPWNGSEIHIYDASAYLSDGCNSIMDDRPHEPPLMNTEILLFCDKGRETIKAENNYWGNHQVYGHDPAHRIVSDVDVSYIPFLEEPCIKTEDGKFVVIKNSDGTAVVDTIFTLGVKTSVDSLSNLYALAAKHFFDCNFNEAKQVYLTITQEFSDDRKSIEAYTKLYTISKLTNSSNYVFSELKNYYTSKLSSIQDTLIQKVIKHLSNLCLVAKEEYIQAINNFSEAIVQNPTSEEAFFAAIDVLTTSLLDTGNTALGKFGGMDLLAIDANDYRTKLNALIKARNDKQSILTSEIIPTQFSLYQNYPNPFNPITRIQYDIPIDTKVQLKIYDILGREVKTLVNDYQTAGRYNIEFNSSNLASGVYIYQISAKDFVKSRKMMIIK